MKNGKYVLLIAPENYPGKKYRNRYCYEHHFVWWKFNGFVPSNGMEIHHLNGNHTDNNISNLRLVTSHEHRKLHGEIYRQNSLRKFNCGFCGKEVLKNNRYLNMKLKQNKYNKLFCSRSCGAKHQQMKLKEVSNAL